MQKVSPRTVCTKLPFKIKKRKLSKRKVKENYKDI